jgi:predicted small metal-binding protein
MSQRKVIDCRLYPSDKGCTLSIEGTEEEVLETAMVHAVTAHGHTDGPELREQLRTIMKDVEQSSAA